MKKGCFGLLLTLFLFPAMGGPLPVRGLHLMVPKPEDLPRVVQFIEQDLPREGVNVLVLEVNYGFAFKSHPELAAENALPAEGARTIAEACRKSDIDLIPLFNCLGHQSWAKKTFPLLSRYPEFDETPGKYPDNEEIYCRSWCPRHPGLHPVVFALIDELVEAFQARAVHVGMDEVFLIGEEDCPRCRGVDAAVLFAEEVNALHRHLAGKGLRMWMWGDRFLDGTTTGIGEWEAATNGTHPSLDAVPTDIVICDWHYEYSPPTAGHFAVKGFPVVMSPWRKPEVALAHVNQIQSIRENSNQELSGRALGLLHTTWTDAGSFVRAYSGETDGISDSARETAACFKKLFERLRGR